MIMKFDKKIDEISIKSLKPLLLRNQAGLILFILFICLLLLIFTETFFTSYNMFVVSRNFSLMIIVGCAQLFALVMGDLNLSVGAIGALAGITTGFLFSELAVSGVVAVPAGICVGFIAGHINGQIINRTGINAFVTTLGTNSVFYGLVLGFTEGYPFMGIPVSFRNIGRGNLFGIPYLFFVMIFVCFLIWIFFQKTATGRKVLSTGGNRVASRLSGIKVKKISILSHSISGLLAGLAGVLYVARIGSAQPTLGQDWLLMSFAIPIIGGTSLSGGKLSVLGVILGGILMVLIRNGLILLDVDIYWQEFSLGLIILIAVGIDRLRSR